MDRVCFWNYCDGSHMKMTQTLIKSLRNNNVDIPFHTFSPEPVKGAYHHYLSLDSQQKQFYLFKLHILKEQVISLPYDYFIFLDADCYCVRNPGNIMGLLCKDGVHAFLESGCNDRSCIRKDWWGCPLEKFVRLMHDNGVKNEQVYNVNAGFFGVRKDLIIKFYDLAMNFLFISRQAGCSQFTEEPPIAYAIQMMVENPLDHLQEFRLDVWASDWTGEYRNRIPDGNEWVYTDYMTNRKVTANPAIVHAMRSKDELIKLAR